MNPKSQIWQKALLAGGLLLVLVSGLFQIPEVRGHSPVSVWEIKIRQLQKECNTIGKRLETTHDILKTVYDLQGKIPSKSSKKEKLLLVQKFCLQIGARVKYLDAKLAALWVAISNRIPGASPALTAELNRLLEEIKELQRQSGQHRLALESAQKKLQAAKLALAAPK